MGWARVFADTTTVSCTPLTTIFLNAAPESIRDARVLRVMFVGGRMQRGVEWILTPFLVVAGALAASIAIALLWPLDDIADHLVRTGGLPDRAVSAAPIVVMIVGIAIGFAVPAWILLTLAWKLVFVYPPPSLGLHCTLAAASVWACALGLVCLTPHLQEMYVDLGLSLPDATIAVLRAGRSALGRGTAGQSFPGIVVTLPFVLLASAACLLPLKMQRTR